MALTKSLWTSIVDLVSTGQDVSDGLNTAFSNIDDAIDQIDTNTADLAAINNRVTTLENDSHSVIIVGASSELVEQTLVADTPEVLFWASNVVVANGGTDLSYDIVTQQFTIDADGTYSMSGVVTIEAPINDIITVELHKDNLATGFASTVIGRGTGNPIAVPYSFIAPFLVNDELDLYVSSSGTSVTVTSSNVTIAKTEY